VVGVGHGRWARSFAADGLTQPHGQRPDATSAVGPGPGLPACRLRARAEITPPDASAGLREPLSKARLAWTMTVWRTTRWRKDDRPDPRELQPWRHRPSSGADRFRSMEMGGSALSAGTTQCWRVGVYPRWLGRLCSWSRRCASRGVRGSLAQGSYRPTTVAQAEPARCLHLAGPGHRLSMRSSNAATES
jgi:hypothetical protein